VTCSTQPITLLVEERGCALFLHPETGHVWFVTSIAHGQWDWESAYEIDDRADAFEFGQPVEILLRHITSLVATP
jgi:hypothetical protein